MAAGQARGGGTYNLAGADALLPRSPAGGFQYPAPPQDGQPARWFSDDEEGDFFLYTGGGGLISNLWM